METKKVIVSTAKKSAKVVSLATMAATMCVNMGITGDDARAAMAAIHDIEMDMGTGQAKAIVVHMDPFGGLIA